MADICDSTFNACDSLQAEPATDAPAPADAAPDNSTASASTMLWGLLSTAQLVNGYLMYNDYNTFSTTLNTGKTGTQTTNWGATWILTQAPLKYWVNASYATIGMQGASVLAWLLQMLGMNGVFMKLFTLSLLYPLVEIGMSVYAYTQYKTCSATATANWTGITTGSDAQYVSCASYASESYVPSAVNDDKYKTWLGANAGGATLVLLYSFMQKGSFSAAFSGSKSDDSDSAAAASASSSSPASTEPAQSTPAPQEETDSTKDDSAKNADWSSGGDDWTSGQNDWGSGNDWQTGGWNL